MSKKKRQQSQVKITSKEKRILWTVILIGALFIAMVPTYIGMAKSNLDTPPGKWTSALIGLSYMTNNETVILTWWDYGYWVEYYTEAESYIDPGQDYDRVIEVSKFFLSYDEPKIPPVDYLIVDNRMIYDYNKVMASWAGRDTMNIDPERTYIGRIWRGEYPDKFKIIYDNGVKIYEVGN